MDLSVPQGQRVLDLGHGLYSFTWPQGFYITPFVVSSDSVLVVDPVNEQMASALLGEIRGITSAPVETLVYSHDHRDHIVGGSVLGATQVYAHPLASARISRREDSDVLPPNQKLEHGTSIMIGEVRVESRYYGPSHSESLCPIVFSTPSARHLYFCDVLDVDIAPYRNLPDTDLSGLLEALEALEDEGGFDRVIGAHSEPVDNADWVGVLRSYFADLKQVSAREWASSGGQIPLEDEDGIAMTERVRGELCRRVADALRPKYHQMVGFDAWAPQNADRMLSMLITGN